MKLCANAVKGRTRERRKRAMMVKASEVEVRVVMENLRGASRKT
jgi:hypothetical protein